MYEDDVTRRFRADRQQTEGINEVEVISAFPAEAQTYNLNPPVDSSSGFSSFSSSSSDSHSSD